MSFFNEIKDDNIYKFLSGGKWIKSKTGNTIEREVVIAFRDSKCREIIKLDNKLI